MQQKMIFMMAVLLFVAALVSPCVAVAADMISQTFDVVIYGETPAGIAAAVSAARRDKTCRVVLATSYSRVGGMVTNGLTHPDFRTFEARTGLFREFNGRVEKRFRKQYGADSQELKDSLLGTHAGPEVNLTVLREMLDELPGITIMVNCSLVAVEKEGQRLTTMTVRSRDERITLSGRYFVDATYEGDLMAAADVPFRVGREGREEYGESLAPPQADRQLQGYNFRLTMTDRNNTWPEGDAATRQRIFDEHLRHNVGMLYFLQNDEAVPMAFREDAQSWGLCRDELADNGHLPEQLYVREARRMVGQYVFTQRDTERATNTNHARAVFRPDAIAMGDYGPNCHGTDHEGPLFGGRHTGEFYQPAAPYQIAYGTVLPQGIENLAVPVACSSSHVGFCALRLEPIWMSLGQAAGEAIGLALESDVRLSDVSPSAIRWRLHQTGAATIYTSDVPEESPDFAAVQWWGSSGGFIALDRTADDEPAEYGRRGQQRIGQYYQAFPEHAVELDKPLDERVRAEWLTLAKQWLPEADGLERASTRGEFIRSAWTAADGLQLGSGRP